MSESLPVGIGAALSEVAGLLLSTDSFERLLQGVAELAVRVIAPVATCRITLAQGKRVHPVASADALARQLDEQQYEHEMGSCLQALYSGEVVEAADLAVEDHCSVAALRRYDEVTLSDHLRIALFSRSIIDQAIGIVMAPRRCSPEEAFGTLRTISQRRNIKIRIIAAELVDAVQCSSEDNASQA